MNTIPTIAIVRVRSRYFISIFIWLQIGVIRPISRDSDSQLHQKTANSVNNHKRGVKDNKQADCDIKDEPKKETLIIEKDPLIVPIESWVDNTQVSPGIMTIMIMLTSFTFCRQRRI